MSVNRLFHVKVVLKISAHEADVLRRNHGKPVKIEKLLQDIAQDAVDAVTARLVMKEDMGDPV